MGNWKDLIDYRHVDDLEIPEMYLWSAFSPFWKGIVYHRLSHWEVLCKYIIGYIYMDKIMDRSRVGPCISSILTSDGGPRAERNSEENYLCFLFACPRETHLACSPLFSDSLSYITSLGE